MNTFYSNTTLGKKYGSHQNHSSNYNHRPSNNNASGSGMNSQNVEQGDSYQHRNTTSGGAGYRGAGFKGGPSFRSEIHGYPNHRSGFGDAGGSFHRQGGAPYSANGGYAGGGGGSHYHREEKPEEEIFKEHTPGINFDLYEAIKVMLTPNDTEPCDTFVAMNLEPSLNENVTRCRYNKPTPVQRYGIPCVLKGQDLMACAQTGSGKTAAYLIPAINFMLMNNLNRTQHSNCAEPSALVLSPTRELSIQIYEEGRKFTYRTGIRCVVVYGGADPRYQIQELLRGCGLLVATPGRLWDLYSRGYVCFSGVRFLVLDEADRMLDMGFEPQIRQIVQSSKSDMPRAGHRQTLLYSATFPKEIQQLAHEFLHSHYFLQVGRIGSTTESITQDVRWVEDSEKRDTLLSLLRQHDGERVLVFVEKKRDADYLERFLRQNHITCASIHGDRVQREREEALSSFKNGPYRVLVATDVASRGLDIPNVAVVVQYDLPSNIDDYVHRIGRTGRAGKQGTAVSFFNEKNRNIVNSLIPLLNETNQIVLPQIQALAKKPNNNNTAPNNFARGRGGFSNGFRNNNGPFGQRNFYRGGGYFRGWGNRGGYGDYNGNQGGGSGHRVFNRGDALGSGEEYHNMGGGSGFNNMRSSVFGQHEQQNQKH
ncbi:unnamed protein product [Phytomonas sp. Hart1]|nr:unnamed protein product [Phytomonas sp. Hart1]|eukprot:CCW70540.1 unnamed protein product [Phytomonas sp. isolate Hart1]